LHHLVELALMASLNIPFYVTVKQQPPEVVGDSVPHGVESLVAEAVVGVMDEGKAEWRRNI